jgi:hypothetical protein
MSKVFEMLMFAAMSWTSRSGKRCATLLRGLSSMTSYLRTRETVLPWDGNIIVSGLDKAPRAI